MKKIIGILGVVVIVIAMFFNTSAMNNPNGDLDLVSLLTINTANAEDDCDNWIWPCDSLYNEVTADCVCTVMVAPGGVGGSYTIPGSIQVCQSGGPDFCLPDLVCFCGYV